MKITPKQYAEALVQALEGQSGAASEKLIANFVRLLAAQNDLGRAEQILERFGDVWRRQQGLVEAEIISARETSEKIQGAVRNFIARTTGAKTVSLAAKTDKALLGGFILKYGDNILDGSLKSRLAEMRIKLLND